MCPITPPKPRSGIGRTVRSGTNLPIASPSPSLSAFIPFLSVCDDGAGERAGERLLDAEPLVVLEDRDDAGSPRRQVLADLVVKLSFHALVGELADEAPCGGAGSGRRDQRRRRETYGEPDAAAPGHPLAAHVVARLLHVDRAVLGMRDEDDALDLDLLVHDELDEAFEVLRRRIDVLVSTHEDISRCVCHYLIPFIAAAPASHVRFGRDPPVPDRLGELLVVAFVLVCVRLCELGEGTVEAVIRAQVARGVPSRSAGMPTPPRARRRRVLDKRPTLYRRGPGRPGPRGPAGPGRPTGPGPTGPGPTGPGPTGPRGRLGMGSRLPLEV